MIDPDQFLTPFAKKVGENLADHLSKGIGRIRVRSPKEEASVPTQDEMAALRAENEQLRTYVFLVLGLLNERLNRPSNGGSKNEA